MLVKSILAKVTGLEKRLVSPLEQPLPVNILEEGVGFDFGGSSCS
jgi:hypothetical protein